MKKLTLFTLIIAEITGFSQNMISTSGNHFQALGFCFAWNLGEPLSKSFPNLKTILTEDFQQPGDNDFTDNLTDDSLALVDIYNATNGTNWTNNTNWLTGPLYTWYGVSVINHRVAYLDLKLNNLVGTIPESIGNLTALQQLNLGVNPIYGSIPSTIGNMEILQQVWIAGTDISGPIPPEFGNLSLLNNLQLNSNQLTGGIPASLGNLTALKYLWLQNNNLTGTIPEELFDAVSLEQLQLNDNSLEGVIPDNITYLVNLELLRINNNQFTSPLPPGICDDLINLQHIFLEFNNFGIEDCNVIQCLIDNPPLYHLVHSPQNSGFTYPDNCEYGISTDSLALVALYNATDGTNWINQNNWLTGPINSWHGITITQNRVSQIDLNFNNLTGMLPPEIGNLTQLTYLNLRGNQLSGAIPDVIWNLTNLWYLDLGQNEFSGNIPAQIGNLTMLHALILLDNQLSGTIPVELWSMQNLTILSLSFNLLHGILPEEIIMLPNLTVLNLYYNQFSGPLPDNLYYLPNLESLAIGGNYFTGTLSMDLCTQMPHLVELGIDYCDFDGESCEVIQCLIDRGGWNFFQHSPQNSGFVYPDDCTSDSASMMQVVAAAGDFFSTPTFSISFTLGETVTETFQNEMVTLTQGFQQPWDFGSYQWINVVQGWSGISGYIEPFNNDLGYLFEDHQEELVVLSNFNGMYFPSQGINTLLNWNYASGYQAKATEDFDIKLRGLQPDNTSLELEAGWHILPVLSACNVAIDGGLGNVNIQIVKEIAGTKTFWPQYGINTIGDLAPGKAYYILLSDISIIQFPECTQSTKGLITADGKQTTPFYWSNPSPTPQSHLLMIPGEFISAMKITAGDFIGGFTALGLCAGIVEISSPIINHCLTLFADDPLTSGLEGFIEDEPITLKHFCINENKETALEVIFEPTFPNQGFFAVHGISGLKSGEMAIGSAEGDSELKFNIFPNPATSEITISWNAEIQEQMQVQIYNAYGQRVKELKTVSSPSGYRKFTIDISGLGSGTFSVSLKAGTKAGYQKIIIIQ